MAKDNQAVIAENEQIAEAIADVQPKQPKQPVKAKPIITLSATDGFGSKFELTFTNIKTARDIKEQLEALQWIIKLVKITEIE